MKIFAIIMDKSLIETVHGVRSYKNIRKQAGLHEKI
jgi:hypothetical protein